VIVELDPFSTGGAVSIRRDAAHRSTPRAAVVS
jgi:hypothetical protein